MLEPGVGLSTTIPALLVEGPSFVIDAGSVSPLTVSCAGGLPFFATFLLASLEAA